MNNEMPEGELLDVHAICKQRDEATARADRLARELEAAPKPHSLAPSVHVSGPVDTSLMGHPPLNP